MRAPTSVDPRTSPMATERLSRRVSAITESATLAVDARAKALK
ncbi:MAG: aspartate aminotransferase, partial [Actinobacteria bacterium]|nr:aspartate aminotransferase [Actinomycetota bacterium]